MSIVQCNTVHAICSNTEMCTVIDMLWTVYVNFDNESIGYGFKHI